ncbi:MAG: tetratricopeptide repeat protein [Tepidibacter sp.]|uniref:tetratricopeptide repeat protein n=1 Tax=Tepidibacter sp. TaxID=2529387 RepID=UPI0025F1F690|nr:tetratricopeptide repeat protein [Tepidibacter sp.]MCT4509362.1 tetratricopeptide repeat protein [Tepidibacter sp.]
MKSKPVQYIYNPANQTADELINNFVIRKKEFKRIFSEIKKSRMENPEQHYIIQGQRGYGKTTLLNRLYFEVEKCYTLNEWLIPIILPEEQYNVRKLYKLWETICEYLENKAYEFIGICDEIDKYIEDEDYEKQCLNILIRYLDENNKKIIIFIDNIGEMLSKFKDKEQQRLREVLMTCSYIRIIGASSESLEYTFDYSKPFYEFFKFIELKGLSLKDTKELLGNLGRYSDEINILKIIEENEARIEALRRLTGGVPRTIVLLFDIFIDSNGDSFKDLEVILDRVTPLYKHRMDNLSGIQQEIIDAIAFNWDAINTKEISKKIRMESKKVAAQLNKLEKNRIIIKIPENKKNYMYQINERFFNIWYLMRFGGRKDKNKVKWLVHFLESWCSKEELIDRARKHIKSLKEGKIYSKYALYMTEALASTKIDNNLQHELIKNTRGFLENNSLELLEELSNSDIELYEEYIKYNNNNNFKECIKIISEIKNKSEKEYYTLAKIYNIHLKDYKKAEEYYLKALDSGNRNALNSLGILYIKKFKDYKKGEEYLLRAVDSGNIDALNNLGIFYDKILRNYKEAEKYYLKALDAGYEDVLNSLGVLYIKKLKNYKKAEEYLLRAVDSGDIGALNNLGVLYVENLEDYKKAEEYFLRALDNGDIEILMNLGKLYIEKLKDYEKAEEYYLKAVNFGNTHALNSLGILYSHNLKDYKKAEKYYLKAIDAGNIDGLNNLGVLYSENLKEYKKAEEYYLKAVDAGDIDALNNLAVLYSEELKEYKKAEEYYLKAVHAGDTEVLKNLGILYTEKLKEYKKAEEYYLKAVDLGYTDILNNLGILYIENLKEYKKAEEYLLRAVDFGDINALNNLGILYSDNLKEYKKAEEYFLKAVDEGYTEALNSLGILYSENLKEYKKGEEYFLKSLDSGNMKALMNVAKLYRENLKEYKKAEEYYLKAVDEGYTEVLNSLGVLYSENLKDYEKAEKYYLKAVNEGDVDSLNNLGVLYSENLRDYEKAEKYYLKAVDEGYIDASINLAYLYFKNNMKPKKNIALELVQKTFDKDNNLDVLLCLAIINLWNNNIKESLNLIDLLLKTENVFEEYSDKINNYFVFLIAKKQYHSLLKIFDTEKLNLKNRFKPTYYALISNMLDEHSLEYKKMGSELKETVEEIILEIEKVRKQYFD